MEKRKKCWILLYLASFCCLCQAQSHWKWMYDSTGNTQSGTSGFPMRSDMACDGYTTSLRCPGTDVIQIITAEYGRQTTETCSATLKQIKNTNCALPEALKIMSKQCNNETECSFAVTSDVFPDPCPGTHKYLRTTYNCVKFMFACPGSLTGIGSEEVTSVEFRAQDGAWVKDPLFNVDYVFFVPYNKRQAQTMHIYDSWDNFVAGSILRPVNLPTTIAEGKFVVYDGDLYYIEDNTRNVVKYSLITNYRMSQGSIPAPKTQNRGSDVGDDITISADENGLWVTYASSDAHGNMEIAKLDKDLLTITNTWKTTYNPRNALHTFVICGVVYAVSSTTGLVQYSYNTNLDRYNEVKGQEIVFDTDRRRDFAYIRTGGSSSQSRRKNAGRSFLRYNTSTLAYNPRDRHLYAWDRTSGRAISYQLHFDSKDPTQPEITTSSTTTTTTRRTTTKTTRKPMLPETPLYPTPSDMPPVIILDYCPPVTRSDIMWPKTKAGDVITLPCPDRSGATAMWSCVRDSSMRKADWHVAGPDLSKCLTWISSIERNYDQGILDRAAASEELARDVTSNKLSDKAIQVTAELVEKLMESTTTPSKYEAERIAKSLTSVSSNLLSGGKDSWMSMSATMRTEIANSLITSVERAGFLYADTVAATPSNARSDEPLVVAYDDILMQVEIRDRESRMTSSNSLVTSFPSEKSRQENAHWAQVGDVIELSNSAIMSQKGVGPASVVFVLYSNMGDFLSPPSAPPRTNTPPSDEDHPRTEDWQVDTRIISASFRDVTYEAELASPAVIFLEHKKPSSLPRRCVYWDYSERSKTGNWSDKGCRRVSGNSTHTKCECDHLTSFAVLVNTAGVTAREIEPVLDIVTSIGISIAIICLIVCILTFSCFRNLHSDRNTIHKHLCICLLVAESLFLIGINQTKYEIPCAVIAGVLHYSFLAAFIWLALEGFQLYVMLVEVFEGNSRWKWYYLAGYGIPAVIVGVSAAVDHSGYGTDEVCWLKVDSGFIWSFVGPVCLIILANLVFLSITVYKMYMHTLTFSDSSKINSIKASVRGASVLLCLLGITWAFGILWISEHMSVLAYLFCIFNTFQGLFIFVFHCLLPRKVRQEYTRCFSRLPCCQNMSRDTYVSNSMSFSKQYTPGRFANGTSGGTQPTLSHQSQLRRMWTETVAHGPKNPEPTTVTSELPNRDSSRPGSCSHRVASQAQHPGNNEQIGQHDQAPALPSRQQPVRQEDDVFLPPDQVQEPRQQTQPESVALLQNEAHQDEIDYDHLQRHHHHYHPVAPFHPEQYPQPNFHATHSHSARPMHSSTVAHSHSGHVHPHSTHFNSTSFSQSRIHDMLDDQVAPRYQDRRFEGNHPAPQYWADTQGGHHYQGSFEDNVSNAKRDSGISMQHPPSNSMVHQLTNDMHRNKVRRSLENITDGLQTEGSFTPSRRYSQSNRAQEDGVHPSYTQHARHQRHPDHFSSGNQSFDDQDKDNQITQAQTMAPRINHEPRCTVHNSVIIGPNERPGKAVTLAGGNRRRKSLSSDSDDPIVTDCSMSSTASSYGNPLASLSRARQENINEESYFEEKSVYHKRRLPDPVQCMESHREQWGPKKSGGKEGEMHDPHEDENDREVEMITAPDHVTETSHDPSSMASAYHHQQINTPLSSCQMDERYVPSSTGHRAGPTGKTYSTGGPHMQYYNNRNSGKMGAERQSPGPQGFNKSGYRYPQIESMDNTPEIDINSSLRMMTNL